MDRAHNISGTPFLPSDVEREARERGLAQSGPVALNAEQRRVVEATVQEVCRHNDWSIHELSVRSNHVHLVVAAPERPEQVMRSLKSWSTRRLREADLIGATDTVWSRHGSTLYLWKQDALEKASGYVRDGQGKDI